MNGIVVAFPSGHPLVASYRARPRSVERFVRHLAKDRIAVVDGTVPMDPLPIRLRDLTGIDDATIVRLTALAHAGVLAPASAARLATRHAAEVGGRRTLRASAARDASARTDYELTVSGDPFGRFAMRLQGSEAWIGFASMSSLDHLFGICIERRGPICLLVGCDARRRSIVRLVASADWQRCLTRIRASGTLLTGVYRHAHGQVLVLGGLPACGRARSSVRSEVERALRRSGSAALARGAGTAPIDARCSASPPRLVRALLELIELVLPGLVDVELPEEEHAP